jgi:hypothetical protein
VKRIAGFLGALTACISIPMALIRPADTAVQAGHEARDQTPAVKRLPPVEPEPVIVRPQKEGPFRLPVFVPDEGFKNERTARQPGGSTSE